METGSYDVVIIGGGPAGSTAAIYAARAELKTLVLDKGLRTGAMGLASKLANYPGLPGEISGAELLGRMRAQAEGFGARFEQDRVLSVDLESDPKTIWTTKGMYAGRTVVIATGALGRTSTVPGEERLLGLGVSYCATCDGAFFRGQEVAVAGNNQEAVEEALYLTEFAERVHLLVQTAELNVPEELAAEVQGHPKVALYPSTRLREILGDGGVEAVRIAPRGGEEQDLAVAGAFLYLQGAHPITDFLQGQLPTTESGCLEVDDLNQTIIPGVFAIGDVLCTHVKQVVISAAEGARAAMAIRRLLSGRDTLRPDWS
ncbi:MAG: FAD-dependent oxidoreductase [Anaerolineae bacterium]|nr:FAD-dependent oxidoreductase [Anaerolineae bacterium]